MDKELIEIDMKTVLMEMNKDIICPMCKYNISSPVNYGFFAKRSFDSHSLKVKTALLTLANTIRQYVPSDNNAKAQSQFLWAIKDLADDVIIKGIESYLQSGQYVQGKGYAYVKVIVTSSHRNSDAIKYAERKRYGASPPVKILEEGDE